MNLNEYNFHINYLIGKKVYIFLKNNQEIEGFLVGFDSFLNLVLVKSLFLSDDQQMANFLLIRGSSLNSIKQFTL
ncbi:small nuclear ribonucleoprotein G (nucleomorph) [Cryptomonas paramecium]|uniref:Small nuclear ribonucleoprotein G n=1 Tax=Cryptomonas paramaecium TaxID=2898 RepID=F2HID7_9CRYP|nr:small nuclear ribonucleoprotein G [Cryptomonas paramecium]AEA39061.1 small nuclear ribonucleoprotein G [Cryptomonas paramecium]